jgi:hypothetical protein
MNARRAAFLLSAIALVALCAAPARSGVKFGDAVPGVIKGTDLERIKRQLNLERFSVVAAVRLGAEDGREAVVVEPLDDPTLARVDESCRKGGFCPGRFDFVGSRLRIVLLQSNDVLNVVTVDREARGPKGRLFDLRELMAQPAGATGRKGDPEVLGWNGWADAASDHVALVLIPIVAWTGGRVAAGVAVPLRIQWNDDAGRFQRYSCEAEAEDETSCWFLEEVGY